MTGKVDVFLEKDGKMEQVQVELRVEGGRKRGWFVEKKPEQPQRRSDEKDDETVTDEMGEDSITVEDPVAEEQAIRMSVYDPEERETGQKMWLVEKVTTLENEKEEMIATIEEMRANIELQEKTIAEMHQRYGAIEATIAQMVEQVQRQNMFNEGVRASFTSLAEVIGKHQDNFLEVVRIFQAHEEHMAKTGAASQEMAQYINALIKENENKTVWISSLMRVSGTNPGPSATPILTASPGRSDQESGEPTTTTTRNSHREMFRLWQNWMTTMRPARIFRMVRAPTQDHRTPHPSAW